MQCEMCGKDTELFKAIVEGIEINVCKNCSSFGKVLKRVRIPSKEEKRIENKQEDGPEIIQLIIENYASSIKNARESKGMKQEDLAKKINEKESRIHSIESSHHEPSMKLARKLEKFLGITLVETQKIEKENKKEDRNSSTGGLTIGDIINLKKK